eukprot:m.162225 g.162225  ORF g.162225 m.162225 type:complete len:91 (+) comp12162_c0_seq1:162-434(+)
MSTPRVPSEHTARAVKISIAWAATIVAGAMTFMWARDDIDRRRRERMAIEGPQYRRRVPKDGVPVMEWDQLEAQRLKEASKGGGSANASS